MRQLLRSNLLVPVLAISLLTAFTLFMLVTAANLNYATIQGIDGPLHSHEVSALQLSTSMMNISGALLAGLTLSAVHWLINCRSAQRI